MDYSFAFVWLVLGYVTVGYVVDSLILTTFPERATEGKHYTLVCSRSKSARVIDWFLRNDRVITSRYISGTPCQVDQLNNAKYNTDVSWRVSVSCSFNQSNLTLTIDSAVDNRSVWWCAMNGGGNSVNKEVSNNITIACTVYTHRTTGVALTWRRCRGAVIRGCARFQVVETPPCETSKATCGESTTNEGKKTGNSITSTSSTTMHTDMSGHSPSPAAGTDGLQVVYIVVGVAAAAVVVVVSVLCVVRRKGWSPVNEGETEHIGSINLNISTHVHHNNENLELQNNSDPDRVTDNGIYVGDSSSDGDSTEWSSYDDDEVTADHVNEPRIYNTPNYYGNVDHQCDVFHVEGQNVHPGEWTERETSGYVTIF